MAEEFLKAMGRLTVFVICAQMLVYFRPKQVYEKYLRLLMNLLILLQLLLPVGNFLRGGTAQDLQARYEDFQDRLEEYMEGTARRAYESWGTGENENLAGEEIWGGDSGAEGLWEEGVGLLREGETSQEGQGEKLQEEGVGFFEEGGTDQGEGGTSGEREEGLRKEGEVLWEEEVPQEEVPGENNAAGQNGPGVSGGIEAVERVEIPAVELGGNDER